jgi:hypothetical protein
MDATSKYQMPELGPVEWGFSDWLEEHAGKEAAKTYHTILAATIVHSGFYEVPDSRMTRRQKLFITDCSKELAKAAAWLKVQGVLPRKDKLATK